MLLVCRSAPAILSCYPPASQGRPHIHSSSCCHPPESRNLPTRLLSLPCLLQCCVVLQPLSTDCNRPCLILVIDWVVQHCMHAQLCMHAWPCRNLSKLHQYSTYRVLYKKTQHPQQQLQRHHRQEQITHNISTYFTCFKL